VDLTTEQTALGRLLKWTWTWQFGKVDLAKLATQLGNFAEQTLVTDMASFILHSEPIVLEHQTKCSIYAMGKQR
jgi:hypothetical protein